jgi:hypothetical protein
VVWAGGGRVGLVSNPEIEREVVIDGMWSDDRAFEEFEQTFRPTVERKGPFS